MGRRIYIDLGANRGHTVREFVRTNPGYMVFAFELNPQLARELRKEFAGPSTDIHIMECAAWIYDGIIDFYFGRNSSESSTVLRVRA